MSTTYESVLSSAMQLEPQDRCRVANSLWDSTRPLSSAGEGDLDNLLDQREAELERDPAVELSHEAFIGHFSHRRRS